MTDVDSTWIISFGEYDPSDEKRREAIFALGNGMFMTRAATLNARQDKAHYPGTYRAGCYNRVPNLIEGELDETESLVNLPNWLHLAFRVADGSWLRLDEADILDYRHTLDLRNGIMQRAYLIRDAAGRHTYIREERLVSMAQPHLCALRVELVPQNWSGDITVCSVLDGDVANTNVERFQDYKHRHLVALKGDTPSNTDAVLYCCTSHSRIGIAYAMRTIFAPKQVDIHSLMRTTASAGQILTTKAAVGKALSIEKIVALYTTQDPSVRDEKQSAQEALQKAGGFLQLRTAHADAWDALWSRIAIEAEDRYIARALRFHAFHIFQTVSPHTAELDIGIPSRGWHGEAYHGHIFWDELFVLPFLNFRLPEVAKAVLMYRYRRLGAARHSAHSHGYRGAMYPWRSASDGREVTPRHQKNLLSGQWMHDYTYLQRHIGSAIAVNIWQYYLATGDTDFLAEAGAEMMLEIARFWSSIATPTADGYRFEIKGVIGPDEYHNAYPGSSTPGLNNNAYTNVMAVWTLCRAIEILDHLPADRRLQLKRQLALDDHELALWERISRRMVVPFHGDNIISQFDGFAQLQEFQPEMLPPSLAGERTDWALRAIGSNADYYQVTKQADVLTLFYLLPEDEVIGLLARLGYQFNYDDIRRTAQYYLTRTMHRSSLSRIVYAGALARVAPPLSWDLYLHALSTDLNPLKGESIAEGVHLGAMGGTLDILQRRYLGICACAEGLRIGPAIPANLGEIRLRLQYRASIVEVEASGSSMRIRAQAENRSSIPLLHNSKRIVLEPGGAITLLLNGNVDRKT